MSALKKKTNRTIKRPNKKYYSWDKKKEGGGEEEKKKKVLTSYIKSSYKEPELEKRKQRIIITVTPESYMKHNMDFFFQNFILQYIKSLKTG